MTFRPTDAHLAVIAASTAHTFTQISIGDGHRTPDGTETALVSPFNPAREHSNPPGTVDENTRVVDWIDGATGDSVTYTASEAGLWATPAGGSEYLAFYDSHATSDLFTKTAGSIISHRFLMIITYAQLANATFNVSAVPQATDTIAGVARQATAPEVTGRTGDGFVSASRLPATQVIPAATASVAGIVELESNAEADAAETNASNTVAVTPSKWWRMFTGARIVARLTALTGNNRLSYNSLRDQPAPGVVPQASESVAGVLEIASNSESDATETNSRNDRAVTPTKWWRMFTGAADR